MKHRLKRLLLLTAVCLPMAVVAQTRKVSGIYTFYAPPTMSVKQAMETAIENAKAQALAKEFGTRIVHIDHGMDVRKNDQESNTFMQLNASEVKGEWLEDLKEPKTQITSTMDDGTLVIEAEVSGKARPLGADVVEFEALPLRNATERRAVDDEFFAGDDLYLYFTAPTDGYVAVYLVDETQTAYCLLPYAADDNGQQPVQHGKEYYFFSKKHPYDLPAAKIDECYLTCDDDELEHNQLYVIFSPNAFTKPVDSEKQADDRVLPRQLSFKDFGHWMGKLGARDKQMNRKIIRFTVKKK